ncbi:hypothetical protein K6V92_19870 [Cupriavidus respiraculi]|uniref:pilus assembly protein n=1 Tax=Cupriavidus respiraculi TaxID=195930 RepID=UPI001C95BA18|nr:PilC/PilY family type IV pilus protein [Cupriavidus respiraculi]MBY4948873.1 hypothetical protein [Cupriavidus respiraculi]
MRLPFRSARAVQAGLAALAAALALVSVIAPALAAPLNLATRPLYAGGNVPPLVMIDLSKDHTLHQKAYNDYTDLDGNGSLEMSETTYNNGFDYFGYFDHAKCYRYDGSTLHAFVPAAAATGHYCDGTTWSGNFLNWASMSRIDEVRKILYGGYRSTDTASTTVLERAFLPMDAHAWSKYYNGTDIARLVPFTVQTAGPTLTSSTELTLRGDVFTNVRLSAVDQIAVGDQLRFTATGGPAGTTMTGWVSRVDSGNRQVDVVVYGDGVSRPAGAATRYSAWSVVNLSLGGLTICNVTPKGSTTTSQENTSAPQLRVVSGNYATWGASEKWQCNWYEERNNTQSGFLPQTNGKDVSGSSNGNRAAVSGIHASAENPSQSRRGLGDGEARGVYNARVQACVAGLIGEESCTQYGSVYKPTGLLQKYGENGQMLFGLMTGTYDKNISGGVLRQNVVNFSQEVNKTNGTFTHGNTTGAVKGIVWNIDRLRPYGYSYGDGGYTSADQCNYQQTAIVPSGGSNAQGQPANEGNCSTWGNPISEIYLETLRYFAGRGATSAFQPRSNGKDKALGLTVAQWANPLDHGTPKAPYCSPLNALVFNSSVSSYDDDQLDGFANLGTSDSNSTWTDKVGAGEALHGKSWFMGGVKGNSALIDNLCSGKQIDRFSDVLGICPEGPSQKGTFQIAGAAYFARTNRIRTRAEAAALGVPDTDDTSLKVTTYAVQLATTTPRISVNVGGKTVNIVPSYLLKPGNAAASTGTLVDFKVISKTDTSGKFYINWEDSVAGGDYDQDVWGILSYTVNGSQLSVSTQVVSASTSNGQGFGYVISGTTRDGPHFHSGILGFSYTDPNAIAVTPAGKVNTSGGCQNCQAGDPMTTATYTVAGNAASQFADPLLYAAKWGGFKDLNGNNQPDLAAEWDARLADGTGGSDGLPDTYFYANNPAALSSSLERAFLSILQTSSASSVATNSSSLKTGTMTYQARFNGVDWSGQLLAHLVEADGTPRNPAEWDAGELLNRIAPGSRQILSFDNISGNGIAFRWDALPASYKAHLNRADAQGSRRLDYLRGDHGNEGTAVNRFRVRAKTVLGDIVNSNPQYVGAPAAGWVDTDYATFVRDRRGRTPMLYVGANDGMLHGFVAAGPDAGKEKFAYVPSVMYPQLAYLTDQSYAHAYYVDGTAVVNDARINGNWTTVLVGTLGAGGAGVFALDVSDPDQVTEGNAATKVLWEFTNQADPDLGYTFGQASIVKLRDGRWAAIFGNGYNSTAVNPAASGEAYLYVVFLDRAANRKTWVAGTDYLKIPTGAGTQANPNGLAQVFPADVDVKADGITDIVYAGDLQGNVWKFDMRHASAAGWGVGTARTHLFRATDPSGNVQPITTSVDVLRNPAGGYNVLFGTGRYVDTADPGDMSVQTLYGIWDRDIAGLAPMTRSALVQQTILREATVNGDVYRVTSDHTVAYSASGAKGWFMDLVTPPNAQRLGERVAYNPLIRGSRVVFTTLVPSLNSCDNGGYSNLMELDARSGGRLLVTPFDVNGDGIFDSRDLIDDGTGRMVPVSGVRTRVGIVPTPTVLDCGQGKECKFLTGSSGNQQTITESAGKPKGRISWREILR